MQAAQIFFRGLYLRWRNEKGRPHRSLFVSGELPAQPQVALFCKKANKGWWILKIPYSSAYTNLRVEKVPGFRYVEHTVISTEPESDALDRVFKYAKENGIDHPRVIGWDFPKLSLEQINVFKMHGYTAAWILPEDLIPEGLDVKQQSAHKYAAIHIERPFDNPFVC